MIIIAVVNDATERARLTPPAVRGFTRLAAYWALTMCEQVDLLGGSVSRSTLRRWATGARPRRLDADQLTRVSCLLAIHEGVERIWRAAPTEPGAWIRRHRPESPFHGLSPLERMRRGGIPAMLAVRAWVDHATGGPPGRGRRRLPIASSLDRSPGDARVTA